MEETRQDSQTINKQKHTIMSWATVLKAGAKTSAKWIGKGAKATVETVGKTALHPQQTLKGAGTAVKTAVVGGSLGYVGWKKLTTDDSVVGIDRHLQSRGLLGVNVVGPGCDGAIGLA